MELPGVTTELGLQASVPTASGGRIVMLPPLPVIKTKLPEVEAPSVLVSEIDVPVVTLDESVTFTVATTPFEMVLVFNPESRHIYDPALPEQ